MPCSGFPYVVVFSCVHLFDVRGGFSFFLILVELLTITLWINTLLFILSGAVRRTWVQPPVFSWVDVTQSLVLCECFVDRCLSFWLFFVLLPMGNDQHAYLPSYLGLVWFMIFKATFNKISVISCRSVLLVEETRVPGENQRPVASHWQTLSYKFVSSTPRHEWGLKYNISSDRHWLHS